VTRESELWTVTDAVDHLGLSADTLRDLSARDQLPAIARGKGGAPLYRREDLEQLAREHTGVPVFTHAVQLYEDDEHLSAVAEAYVADGLRRGEGCLILATSQHRATLERRLEAGGIDVAHSKESEQLLMLDAREALSGFARRGALCGTLFEQWATPLLARARRHGERPRLRVLGEIVDVLCADGNADAALTLEEFWNQLGKTQAFSLLCAYSMARFPSARDAAIFDRLCGAHATVAPAEPRPASNGEAGRLRAGSPSGEREVARLQQRAQALATELEERRRIEAELGRQNRKLELALREKDEFLAILGHELRNPLAPIQTALDLLAARGSAGPEHAIIERHVRHLTQLIDDLHDTSRLLRGKVEIERRRADVGELVARGIELAEAVVRPRAQDLELRVPSGLYVDGDARRLTQVVANLVINALKYSRAGSKVEISAGLSGATVELRFRDHGAGISPDLIDQVFEPFVQQPRGLDRSGGGLGVGLTIVRSLVVLHGGSVSVKSQGLGAGSEFVVALPAIQDPAAQG